MPLPSSGQITFNDLNTALLRTATNQLLLSDAADNLGVSYNTIGTDQLGMDEFYGKSYTGYAYTMSVSPTQSTIVAAGETKTYTYTSDGTFGIVNYPSWATPSIQSGSAGTNLTFTVAFDSQALDAAQRTGTITLQSPLATSKYIYVTQSANPATLTINGGVTYDYRGGSTSYYVIDTSPESQITWNATLDTYVGFGHRVGASGAFSNTTLSGTGDANIYISASANNSTTTDRTATITVDPQNIVDPNVTATVTVLQKPNLNYQIDIGGGNYQNVTYLNFAYNAYGSGNAQTVRFSTNQSANSANISLTGGNSTKFSYTDQGVVGGYRTYKFYPTEFNGSGATYTTTARVTFLDLNFDLTLNQASAPAPTVTISPSSNNWTYTDTSNVMFTATIDNKGNATTGFNFTLNSPYFKLVDYSGTDSVDGAITVSNPNGNVWTGVSSNPSPYTYFYIYARPVGGNYTAGTYSTTLTATVSTSTGTGTATSTLTQTGAPAFTSADWNGSVSITNLGAVSSTNGNSTTTVGVSPSSFAVVTSDTSRTVTISNVTVPSGYSNSGAVLADFTRTATQPAAPRTLTLSPDGTTTVAGTSTSVTLTIDDVYYTDTSWTLTTDTYGGYAQLGSVGFAPSNSGTGDGTRYLTFSQNTSGVDRANRVNLTGGDTMVVIQNSYTPGPSFGSYSTPSDFLYYEYNSSAYYKVATFTVSGVHSAASFTLNSPYFKIVDYSSNAADDGGITVTNPNGNYWVGSANYTSYTTYKVYIIPQQQNNGSSNLTTTLTMAISYTQNGGGSVQQTATLTQLWNPSISASPSSLSFVASSAAEQSVSVSSNIAWTGTVSGTGFEIASTSGGTFGTTGVSKTGNDTIYVKPTDNSGGARTGTLTITGNSPYSSTTTSVALSQAAGDLSAGWYARTDTGTGFNALTFYYKINGGAWVTAKSTTVGTGYTLISSAITVPNGGNITLAVQTVTGTDKYFSMGYNTTPGTSYYGKSSPYTDTPSSAPTYYMNIIV